MSETDPRAILVTMLTGRRALLPGFDATQHLAGPLVVQRDGAAAIVETHVRGYHNVAGAAGGDRWMVAGHSFKPRRPHSLQGLLAT